jgi:hypothetical protein
MRYTEAEQAQRELKRAVLSKSTTDEYTKWVERNSKPDPSLEVVDPEYAFEDALRNGMPDDGKYHYMYMYSSPTMHFFKHGDTREYVQYNRIC